jgi:hypothetical protein
MAIVSKDTALKGEKLGAEDQDLKRTAVFEEERAD